MYPFDVTHTYSLSLNPPSHILLHLTLTPPITHQRSPRFLPHILAHILSHTLSFTPLTYHLGAPNDYFRFTHNGIYEIVQVILPSTSNPNT